MSPEQLEGRPADAVSDIFAFGALVFEMLTGRRAFDGAAQANVIAAIMHDEPPPISTIQPLAPPALDRSIRKCLVKSADARWQTARDLADDLDWIAERPAATDKIPARSGQFNRLVVPLAAAIFAVAATLAVVSWLNRGADEQPIAFVIPPPDGVVWGDTPPEPMPAVSPDGRSVAFVGESQEGQGLWVRDVGQTQARLVPGSVDFGGPRNGLFWSSDSTRVGYCVRNSLRLHALAGGPPAILECGCTSGSASWNQAGEILFRGADGIYRISERGGLATRVTALDSSRELTHNFPRWLPDGRRFIYTVVGPDADAAGIYAATVDGPSRTRILTDVSRSDFVEGPEGSAYLVFVRRERLMAQAIDPATLALVGDASVLAERMAMGNVAMPSFSATTSLLVHRSGGAVRPRSLRWVDRQGNPLTRYGSRDGVSSAALSPDESTLIYTPINPDGSNGGLRMVDIAGRSERSVLDPPPTSMLPSFSRSGRRVAFASAPTSGRELYVMDLTASKPVQVAAGSNLGLMAPEWSTDDRALIGTDSNDRIVAVEVDTSNPPVTLVEQGSQAHLSPDGRWLAYTTTISGTPEVYVQGFPGGERPVRVSAHGGMQPRWRGDGGELFYLTADGTLVAVGFSRLFQGGEPTRLFREPFLRTGPTPFDRTYLPGRDGQSFLLLQYSSGPVPLTAVRNWLPLPRQ